MSYYQASTYIKYYLIHTNICNIIFYVLLLPPQRYKRNYVLFITMENDLEHTSPGAIHATHLSHNIDNHPEVRYNTPHFTAAIIDLHLNYKIEWATEHVSLKRSISTLKIFNYTESASH